MKQLHSVVVPGGKVRHVAHQYLRQGPFKTLCGRLWPATHVDVIDSGYAMSKTRMCENCHRARARGDADTTLPSVDNRAARLGRVLADNGAVRALKANVYRVDGEIDTYTVTIPLDPNFASVCTCMAAKTHPEDMCKHQAAAVLHEWNERNG